MLLQWIVCKIICEVERREWVDGGCDVNNWISCDEK